MIKKTLTGLLYLKSVPETGFGFDKQLTIVNNPITQSQQTYSTTYEISICQINYSLGSSTLFNQPITPRLWRCVILMRYFGKYNYCFGEAIIGGRVSAIYLKRLLPPGGTWDKKSLNLFQDRIVKEAIHEIGHTFGLRHCSHEFCIMFKSKTISDTDKKNSEFCDSCLNSLTIYTQSPLK